MKKLIPLFFFCFFLSACAVADQPAVEKEPEKHEVSTQEKPSIKEYFPLENKVYSFAGQGNEFASYKEIFYETEDGYLPAVVENGGTRILKVYQLTSDGIYTVYEQPEYYEQKIPPIEQVKDHFFSPKPQLAAPLSNGSGFNSWKIIETDAKLKLPFGELDHVIILEQKESGDHSTVTSYWAPGYGKVKQEFIYTEENGEEFIVTSELENINKY